MQDQPPKKRGFAAISPERMREIASAGGIARKRAYDMTRARSRNVDNPQNQANPQVEQAISRPGQ